MVRYGLTRHAVHRTSGGYGVGIKLEASDGEISGFRTNAISYQPHRTASYHLHTAMSATTRVWMSKRVEMYPCDEFRLTDELCGSNGCLLRPRPQYDPSRPPTG